MNGWNPPFEYRLREAPARNLHAHTEFQFEDSRATDDEQERELRNFRNYYENDAQLLDKLRSELTEDLFLVVQKENAPEALPNQETFTHFKEAISADEKLAKLRTNFAAP